MEEKLSQNDLDYVVAYRNPDGKIIGGIPWSAFNEPYREYLFDTTNVQIFFGGGSSGKSHFIFQRTILDVKFQGRNFLIARQKKNTLENSVYTELKRKINDFGLQDEFECKKNPMSITCKANRRQMLFIGLDDIESVKSIVPEDGTFTDVIVEEATEIAESDFDQLRVRQRGVCYKKTNKNDKTKEVLTKRTTIMFNPISKEHWIYKRFFIGNFDDKDINVRYEEKVNFETKENGKTVKKEGKETYLILKTTYRDNKFLSMDDIIKLENIKDPWYREVYVNGNFGSLGKSVFIKHKNWTVADLSELKPMIKNFRNGLDYGGSIDPHAYIKSAINKKLKQIYIFDEFKMNELTIPELWMMIKDKAYGSAIVCERDDDKNKQLRSCGANVIPARKGKNSVLTGIEWLKEYTIIVDKNCKETIYELENYVWKQDKFGNTIQIPIDKNNHIIDALRYSYSYDIIKIASVKTNFNPYNRN